MGGGGATAGASARPWIVGALLGLVVVLCAAALFTGWRRDLPSTEADEPFFVLPAVEMAASGSLNPHWFGHPGSTVIVPLAIMYRAREAVFHDAPLTGHAPTIAQRFRDSPDSFVLLGRLWTILLSLASVVLVFFLGRRVFDDVVGLVAAFCYALVPLVADYGRMVRTDSAGACFGLLALYAIVVLVDRPTARQYTLAGCAIGLAVASRYFLVVLIPVAIGVWWTTRSGERRPGVSRVLLLGVCAVGVFALLTPFFFLDWHAALRSLEAETVGTVTNDHYGWFDGLAFYTTRALPEAIGWPAFVAAAAGIGWTVKRRDRHGMVLASLLVVFLVAICCSSLQWSRWIIPIVPVVLLFSAEAVVAAVRRIASVVPASKRYRVGATLLVVGVCVIAAFPGVGLVRLDQSATTSSTRQLMRSWILTHVPRDTAIAQELKGPELRSAGYPVLQRFDLPSDGTVADYCAHGYHYLLVNAYLALDYRLAARRFPEHAAFYRFLRRHAQLLHDERPLGDRRGPHLKLYRVEVAEFAAAHGGVDAVTTVRSRHDRLRRPKALYPVGDALLR